MKRKEVSEESMTTDNIYFIIFFVLFL